MRTHLFIFLFTQTLHKHDLKYHKITPKHFGLILIQQAHVYMLVCVGETRTSARFGRYVNAQYQTLVHPKGTNDYFLKVLVQSIQKKQIAPVWHIHFLNAFIKCI